MEVVREFVAGVAVILGRHRIALHNCMEGELIQQLSRRFAARACVQKQAANIPCLRIVTGSLSTYGGRPEQTQTKV